MTHKFKEDEIVVLKEGTHDFLPTGSHGTVFCLYLTTPPAYEINFIDSSGDTFGAIRYEDEVERCLNPNCHGELVGANL